MLRASSLVLIWIEIHEKVKRIIVRRKWKNDLYVERKLKWIEKWWWVVWKNDDFKKETKNIFNILKPFVSFDFLHTRTWFFVSEI